MLFKNQNYRFRSASNFSSNSFSLVNELKNAVSGKDGEITAILTYLFQHLVTSNEKISDALIKISKDEMEHMEALSHLIASLGEMPYFVDANNNFFTSRYVNYETTPNIFLKQNIEGEKMAIKEYTRILENTDNENVKAVISEIIEDEKSHLDTFKRLLESVNMNEI